MAESTKTTVLKNYGSKVVRAVVRIVGIAVGSLGLFFVWMGFSCLKDLLGHSNMAISSLIFCFWILGGFYLIYVACTLAFRFSPAAIKQLCGVLSYILLDYFKRFLKYLVQAHYSGKYDEIFYTGFSVLAAIAFYALSSRLLLKWSIKPREQGEDDRDHEGRDEF